MALTKASIPVQKKKEEVKSLPSSDEEDLTSSGPPPCSKMVLRQGPIPKKGRREFELEELLADAERKKEADKVMLWRKVQAELNKISIFGSE